MNSQPVSPRVRPKIGLVLSGGGARGAYQAGVLSGISDVIGNDYGSQPIPIITGCSAGAINASYLASASGTFADQTRLLLQMWSELVSDQVIKTDPLTLGKLGLGWFRDLSSGGIFGKPGSTHLLNTMPLARFLEERIDFDQITRNINLKILEGVSVTCTSYGSGTSVTFYDSLNVKSWSRSARIGVQATLRLEHILASSSIPIFFKPVRIGTSYYGDGGIRSSSPLSPAIHLGANRLIAIGVRHPRSKIEVLELQSKVQMKTIALADIAGVLMNSLFMDALEFDYERLTRINDTVALIPEDIRSRDYKLKPIPTLLFMPSVDLGLIAADQFDRFPLVLRYFLKGLGASGVTGADLLSYLAFDHVYTQSLVAIGRNDALARADAIRAFFDEAR